MPQSSIFISYSHKDEEWLERLLKQLSTLRQQGELEFWSDKNLSPGDHWPAEIEQAIEKAKLAVLLVSVDFLNSDFIMGKELPALLERSKQHKLRKIMPLIVRSCTWKEYPEIANLEVRPKPSDRDCMALGTQAEQEKDLADFAIELLEEFRKCTRPDIIPPPDGPALPKDEIAVLEIQFNHREWDCYNLELAFMQSSSDKPLRPLRYSISLDVRSLSGLADEAEYAQRLRYSLFPKKPHWDFIENVRKEITERGVLRLRIAIGACARELNCIRWELLGLGEPDVNPLSLHSTYFIRYAGADIRSWRDIRRRPWKPLTAGLVAVSFVPLAARVEADALPAHLQEVDTAFRKANIQKIDVHGDLGADDLSWYLRAKHPEANHPDILYLCVDLIKSADATQNMVQSLECLTPLLQALKEVEFKPRLVILAPWKLADDTASAGPYCNWFSLMRLAYEIVETGVIGVLTLQTGLELQTWSNFLTTFLSRLSSDGELDRALHEARCQCLPGVST